MKPEETETKVKEEKPSDGIVITIKHLTAKDFKVAISKTASIKDLKDTIFNLQEIPQANQKIIFRGKLLPFKSISFLRQNFKRWTNTKLITHYKWMLCSHGTNKEKEEEKALINKSFLNCIAIRYSKYVVRRVWTNELNGLCSSPTTTSEYKWN